MQIINPHERFNKLIIFKGAQISLFAIKHEVLELYRAFATPDFASIL